jgi:hypothetical protein
MQMPGLQIAARRRARRGLQNAADDVARHWFVEKAAH